ncbi:MAG: hypothetical protein LBC12_04055 [Nitrososphaerota archaeon]|jgi:hypothetical protein|nr:hypothetical protein [Nitrososphaerota archaeon]
MVKATNKHLILLFAIFVFAFLYRFLLMIYATYPSGSDIGLHNSVIYSIINQGGNVDFLYNYYQMGGGLSITFPGYHIFVAQIMILTSMPEYLVHTLVASLFSSVIVLVSYLITRAVWKESAAIAVAFLMAITRLELEMLLWGGYPNVVTLLLIPVTFYCYIQKNRFTKLPFYISTSILIGSIFLTHSLSSFMFVSILLSVVFFILVFGQKIGTARIEALSWLLPVVFGASIVSPYLIRIVPAYIVNQTTAEIVRATLASRTVPLEFVLSIFVVVGLYFLLSKKYHERYFTVPTVLLALWLFIPTVFTQGYLVGLYTDYHRFLYFVITPIVILIGLFVDHGSSFFARVTDTYRTLTGQLINTVKEVDQVTHRRMANFSNKINRCLTRSNMYVGILISFLLICFFFIPIFTAPSEILEVHDFYQVMSDPLYQAMDWAKVNTPANATFVTTAYYGWWFAGFAQRPTWSAVEPQFISLSREVPIAQMATNLLDTDYLFDSSFKLSDEILYIQVKEDGGYMARHNPQVLTDLNWTYLPYPFFNFNSEQTKVLYAVNGVPCLMSLAKLPVKNMHMENDTQHITVSITKGSEYFTCTQLTTVYQGSKFVNITIILETNTENVSLLWLQSTLEVNALQVGFERSNAIGFLAEDVKAFGQIIFDQNIPVVNSQVYDQLDSTEVHLDYNLAGKKQAEIQVSLTTYSVTNDIKIYNNDEIFSDFFNKQIALNLEPENRGNLPLSTPFNYQAELKINNINYVAVPSYYEEDSVAEMKLKFANDPLFNLVFINNEVAIFEVK